jgi:hypothetical protein
LASTTDRSAGRFEAVNRIKPDRPDNGSVGLLLCSRPGQPPEERAAKTPVGPEPAGACTWMAGGEGFRAPRCHAKDRNPCEQRCRGQASSNDVQDVSCYLALAFEDPLSAESRAPAWTCFPTGADATDAWKGGVAGLAEALQTPTLIEGQMDRHGNRYRSRFSANAQSALAPLILI